MSNISFMFLKRKVWKDNSTNFYEIDKRGNPSHYFKDYSRFIEPVYYKYFESHVDESYYEGRNIYLDNEYNNIKYVEDDVHLYYCDISV